MTNKSSGMTLIELMIVIAVLGVIAAIAYPSFLDQIQKARRADAKQAIYDIASRAEMYYQNYERYPASLTSIGFDSATVSTVSVGGDGHYAVSITSSTDFTYTITANPSGSQVNDKCGSYTLNHLEVKTPSPSDPRRCW